MLRAIALSSETAQAGTGGPFGAVIARGGEVIAEGWNQVISGNDPTAHAEVVAIRRACAALGTFNLAGCEVYTSCEPCPMCLGAIHWARIDRIWFGNDRHDAAAIGFDDEILYREIAQPLTGRTTPIDQMMRTEAHDVFEQWANTPGRIMY